MKSINKEAYWQYDIKPRKHSNEEMSVKIRQSNFKLGNDRNSYNQTTQQVNSSHNSRWLTARGSWTEKPKISREMLLKTQFNLGFLKPDYETSSKAYDPPEAGVKPHKILEKGKGKLAKQHFIYGHNKTLYTSTNHDSYKEIALKDKINRAVRSNYHNSELTEQHNKLLAMQAANLNHIPNQIIDSEKINQFRNK